eukprot:TRINITY_DN2360_c1_g2_i1.p2 TRINITY_DN2360_c1_g2~~TRINITY_DN2360_c1_g2_i1.p2  ORF type:complete len:118 (+),score=4.97 TRINITY_DN2360_c1_g2_i1:560-913(+)
MHSTRDNRQRLNEIFSSWVQKQDKRKKNQPVSAFSYATRDDETCSNGFSCSDRSERLHRPHPRNDAATNRATGPTPASHHAALGSSVYLAAVFTVRLGAYFSWPMPQCSHHRGEEAG